MTGVPRGSNLSPRPDRTGPETTIQEVGMAKFMDVHSGFFGVTAEIHELPIEV